MKRNLLLTLVLAFVACTGAFAQSIPNNSFENWTQIDTTRISLDNWTVISGGIIRMDTLKYTYQSQQLAAPAPDGKYFLGVYNANNTIGIVGTKFAFNSRPDSIKFDAAYFPGSGNSQEVAAMIVVLTQTVGGVPDTISYSRFTLPALFGNGSSTKAGLLPLKGSLTSGYRKAGLPDQAAIYFLSDLYSNIAATNTFLAVDNIRFGTGSVSGVSENAKDEVLSVSGVYPNPFSTTTNIAYELKTSGQVSLKVFDIAGREVQTLVNGTQAAGQHKVEFNGSNLSDGVYFYQLRAGETVTTGKMIISK